MPTNSDGNCFWICTLGHEQAKISKTEFNCKEKIDCMYIQVRDKTDLELTVEK